MILVRKGRRAEMNLKDALKDEPGRYFEFMELFMCYNASTCLNDVAKRPFYGYFVSGDKEENCRKNMPEKKFRLLIKDYSSAVFTTNEKNIIRDKQGDFEIVVGLTPDRHEKDYKYSINSRLRDRILQEYFIWPPFPSIMNGDPLYIPNNDGSPKKHVIYATHVYIGTEEIFHGLAEHDFHSECQIFKNHFKRIYAPAEN